MIILIVTGLSLAVSDCNCYDADIAVNGRVDFRDFVRLAGDWHKDGANLDGDISGNGYVDFEDLRLMCLHWPENCAPYVQQLNVQPCDTTGSRLSLDSNDTRFSLTVQGNNLYFEDMIRANCCMEGIRLGVTVEDSKITIYEMEVLGSYPCPCLCDYPTTAILGPFDDGNYVVEVIDVGGDSLGTVEVTIPSQ